MKQYGRVRSCRSVSRVQKRSCPRTHQRTKRICSARCARAVDSGSSSSGAWTRPTEMNRRTLVLLGLRLRLRPRAAWAPPDRHKTRNPTWARSPIRRTFGRASTAYACRNWAGSSLWGMAKSWWSRARSAAQLSRRQRRRPHQARRCWNTPRRAADRAFQ